MIRLCLSPLLLAACLCACTAASSPAPPAPAGTAPEPLPDSALDVGTTRTLVVLAASPGREREQADYRSAVQQLEALRLEPQELWLGCHPEATAAMGGNGERWVATLSFASRTDAEAFVRARGLSPEAMVEGTIEPCGD